MRQLQLYQGIDQHVLNLLNEAYGELSAEFALVDQPV